MKAPTYPEIVVLDALAAAWNAFVELPVDHDDDTDEFRRAIHSAQEKIMCRSVRRYLNGGE